MKTYQWLNLQTGQLPLQPDGSVVPSLSHICSITLIWPDDEKPNPTNSILVDPCFSRQGYRTAKSKLEKINVAFSDIGFYFVTHKHIDHLVHFPVTDTNFSGEVYGYEPKGGLGRYSN